MKVATPAAIVVANGRRRRKIIAPAVTAAGTDPATIRGHGAALTVGSTQNIPTTATAATASVNGRTISWARVRTPAP